MAPLIPVAPSTPTQLFKEKRRLNAPRVGHWEWQPFRNSARSDDLRLYHWERVSDGHGNSCVDEDQGSVCVCVCVCVCVSLLCANDVRW
jgi:hypothetical protein